LHVYVSGPGATIADEFAAIDRQIQIILATTLVALLVLLLVVYRSPVTALVPLASVFGALTVTKPIVSILVDKGLIGVSLFSLGLSLAVVLGAGTGFAIFLLGRYHERLRQNFTPAEALADAYRAVAPTIIGSTVAVVTSLGAVGFLSVARISMFGTTGILCCIGILTVALAALTLTPAIIALASRVNLVKPPKRQATLRRFRRVGISVARWPGPILLGALTSVFVLLIPLPGTLIGWDEAASTPPGAESNRGYQAVDHHFPPNQLLPDVVTIQTAHDLRNPAGLTAIERITGAIMGISGVRMVQSASHPGGMVSKQASLTPGAGNIGDRLDEFSDQLNARQATFTDLQTAAGEVLNSVDLLQSALVQTTYGIGQVSLAVHMMQTGIDKVRARTSDVIDIFDPLHKFVAAIPGCASNPVCSAAQEVVQWSDTVVASANKLVDAGEQLAKAVTDAAVASSSLPSIPNAVSTFNPQLTQIRAAATALDAALNTVAPAPIRDLPGYLHELAAVSAGSPGADLYAARKILTDPSMRPVQGQFFSPNGYATRLFVYGDGNEWGTDGAKRASAIAGAIADATRDGTLKPTGIQLAGVGPATRDLQSFVGGDLTLMVLITLAVIFVIAAMLLRSPVAGLVLVLCVGTSYVCALGASVLIYQHLFGYSLHWSVAPIAFVALVAVGSACDLLFALRVREERPAGPHVAIIRTFAATGAVVTIAGIVIGTTMFALTQSTVLSVAQIGVTVGVGLLLDALVVRALVLPALMVLLRRWFWWPRRFASGREVPEPQPVSA
jgi:RND superfamily putative drug exporter